MEIIAAAPSNSTAVIARNEAIPGEPVNRQQSSVNQVRTVTWETNYNNKMGCTGFVHIDLAPSKKPVRSEVEKTLIEIYTADKSHPPIKAILFDMFFFKLKNVTCFISLASHGLDEMEFVNFMFEKYGDKINMNTEVAVYYYKRIAS